MLIQATHVDPVLTNISVLYHNYEYHGKDFMPVLPVQVPAGKFPRFKKKASYQVINDVLTAEGVAREVDFETEFDNFSVEYHAQRKAVSDIAQQWANGAGGVQIFDIQVATTRFLKDRILLNYEDAVASLLTNTATYGSNFNNEFGGGGQEPLLWTNPLSTPINDMMTAISSCAIRPNTMGVSRPTWNVLREHPQILDRIKYSQLGVVTEALLAELLDIQKVIVCSAQKEVTSGTTTYPWIWDPTSVGKVWFEYIQPPAPEVMTFGATFATEADEFVRNYRVEERGRGSDMIECHWAYDLKVICQDVGYLLSNMLVSD